MSLFTLERNRKFKMQAQRRNVSTSSDDCQSAIDVSPKRNLKYQASGQFDYCQEATLSDLSIEQLKDLVYSLSHTLGNEKAERFGSILEDECIDGSSFSQLGHDELADIGFDRNLKVLLVTSLAPPSSPQGVRPPPTFNVITDTSSDSSLAAMPTSPSAASKAAPTSPTRTYGQLVVLGFREHRLTNEHTIYPVGSSNDVFPLVRQAQSTGVKVSCTNVYLRPEKKDGEKEEEGKNQGIQYVETIPSCQSDLESSKTNDYHSTPDSTHRMVLESSSDVVQSVGARLAAVTGEALLPYKVEVGYSADPAFDMFQVGRHDGNVSSTPIPTPFGTGSTVSDSTVADTDTVTDSSTDGVSTSSTPSFSSSSSLSSSSSSASPRRVNDIVVKGLVLSGRGGAVAGGAAHKGAISRVACRLLCERSTGRTFVFAGGFNSSKTLALTDTAPQWIHHKTAAVGAMAAATSSATTAATAGASSVKRGASKPTGQQRSRRRLLRSASLDSGSSSSISSSSDGAYEYDALTKQGMKVFFPAVGAWREISVMGRVYTLREEGCVRGILTSESNELQSGCIIDIGGGVCLTYTSGHHQEQQEQQQQGKQQHDPSAQLPQDYSSSMMDIDPEPVAPPSTTSSSTCTTSSTTTTTQNDPNRFLARLNDSKPVCPVLMNSLHFPLRQPPQRHALARLQSLRAAGQDSGFVACHNPSSASAPGLLQPLPHALLADGIEQDQQPYVFPACGHCFGFNAAFNGKACPLCRQEGPYVPLLFPFAKEICAEQPTHVFHPCGHAASLQTCLRWSQIPRPDSASLHEYLFPQQQQSSSRRGGGGGQASSAGGRRPPISRSTGSADSGGRARGVAMGVDPAAASAMSSQYASLCLPQHPACPFCNKKLELTASNERFSKLVVQFEDGDVTLADI